MYGPPDGPMTGETPQRAQGKKGRTRIEMADALLRAHADGRLRVTIGRSSDYYGPHGTGSTVGENIMKPALRGNRARWLGSLDQPHTLNYLEDMARALVTLGGLLPVVWGGFGRPRGQEASLHGQAQIVAHGPVLKSASVVREPDQVDMLHREGLVRCGHTRGEAALVPAPHRHVGGRHVVLDDDPLHLVGHVTEARAKPLGGGPRPCRPRAALGVGLMIDVIGVIQPLDEVVFPAGHERSEGVSDVLSDDFLVEHGPTL
jgi:hypothetical protein